MVVFSFCAVCEKVGVLSSSGIFFFACETFLTSLVMGAFLFFRRELSFSESKKYLVPVLPIGLCYAFMFAAQGMALAIGPVAYVVAIKRSGIIITVLVGSLLFKEGSALQRLFGVLIVLLGATVISFS